MKPASPIVTRFSVKSCANNTYLVTPRMKKGFTRPGVLSRLHMAALIEKRLNGK